MRLSSHDIESSDLLPNYEPMKKPMPKKGTHRGQNERSIRIPTDPTLRELQKELSTPNIASEKDITDRLAEQDKKIANKQGALTPPEKSYAKKRNI